MVERAGENCRLSGVGEGKVRFIIDDCLKFVKREIRRGKKYDAIIMDPPSFGRGPNGETWKIENELFNLVKTCTEVLSDNPLFFLINSYTTGLQPQVIKNILTLNMSGYKGNIEAYEVGDEVIDAMRKAGIDIDSISIRNAQSGKIHIDLAAANADLLLRCGVDLMNIEVCGICTHRNSNDFYSVRALGNETGRFLTGAMMK